MFRKLAKSTADRVPIPLDTKARGLVAMLMYEALGLIWQRLNARERGAMNLQKLGTHLVLELVNPETKKARPVGVIVDRVLAKLRPVSLQIKPPKRTRKQRARAVRGTKRPRSVRAET